MQKGKLSGEAVLIRSFRPADLPRLQEIRSAAFLPVFASFRKIVGEGIARHAFANAETEQSDLLVDLCSDTNPAVVLVAECEGRAVGFVSYTVREGATLGELSLNAVHPDSAGRGVGERLYREALGRMKAAGVKVVEVGTGGDPSHAPARRAYEKVGFSMRIPSVAMYCEL